MKRRAFVLRVSGAVLLLAAPTRAAHAQTSPRVVGFLRTTSSTGYEDIVNAFRSGVLETGLVEGRDVVFDFRWADNQEGRLTSLLEELVRKRVDVIVANAGASVAAKAATSTIPIVFVVGEDPIRMGLVTNLSRPGRNVTGVAFLDTDLAAKRLGLVHELIAPPAPIAVLTDPGSPGGAAELRSVEEANRVLGRRLIIERASSDGEVEVAFAAFARANAGGVFVGAGPYFGSRRDLIAGQAARHRMPAVAALRLFADAGLLASYGPNLPDAYRRGGVYAGRILKGAKPADLPVELPTKYELVLNLKAAKTLGLAIPQPILLRADDVIQ